MAHPGFSVEGAASGAGVVIAVDEFPLIAETQLFHWMAVRPRS
jgi:hypothetical protein